MLTAWNALLHEVSDRRTTPKRFCAWLTDAGHEALHTLDLPQANSTQDSEIVAIADVDSRIVVTKDADFVQSFLVTGKPQFLLLVSTGNVSNAELENLIKNNLAAIVLAFQTSHFVEISRDRLTVHD